MSVFWRASVCDWESSGEKYHAISLGTKYQEQIREYLLGVAELPHSASVLVLVSALCAAWSTYHPTSLSTSAMVFLPYSKL
jgi:hypothetical protein